MRLPPVSFPPWPQKGVSTSLAIRDRARMQVRKEEEVQGKEEFEGAGRRVLHYWGAPLS